MPPDGHGKGLADVVAVANANRHRIKLALKAMAGETVEERTAVVDDRAAVTAARPALCLEAYDAQPPLLTPAELSALKHIAETSSLVDETRADVHARNAARQEDRARPRSGRRRMRSKSLGLGLGSSSEQTKSIVETRDDGFSPLGRFQTAVRVVMQLRTMGLLQKFEEGELRGKNLMTMGRGGAGFAAEPADDAPSRKPIKMRSPDAAAEMLALLERSPVDALYIIVRGCVTLHRRSADATFSRTREALESRAYSLAVECGTADEMQRPNRAAEVQAEVEHGPCILSLGAPWAFNEWPMLRGGVNSFTAVAHPNTVLVKISSRAYWHVVARHKSFIPFPAEVTKLAQISPKERTHAEMMLLSDLVRGHRVFERMEPAKVDELARYIQCQWFDENEILFLQGQVQQALLLIMRGNVGVFRHRDRPADQIRALALKHGTVQQEEPQEAPGGAPPKPDPHLTALGMSYSVSRGRALGAALETVRAQMQRAVTGDGDAGAGGGDLARGGLWSDAGQGGGAEEARPPPRNSRSPARGDPDAKPRRISASLVQGPRVRGPSPIEGSGAAAEQRPSDVAFGVEELERPAGVAVPPKAMSPLPDAGGSGTGTVSPGSDMDAPGTAGSHPAQEREASPLEAHAMANGWLEHGNGAASPTAVLPDGQGEVLVLEEASALSLPAIAEGTDEGASSRRPSPVKVPESARRNPDVEASPRVAPGGSLVSPASAGQGYAIRIPSMRTPRVPRAGGFNPRRPGDPDPGAADAALGAALRQMGGPDAGPGEAQATGGPAHAPRPEHAAPSPRAAARGEAEGPPRTGGSVARDRAMPQVGPRHYPLRSSPLRGGGHAVPHTGVPIGAGAHAARRSPLAQTRSGEAPKTRLSPANVSPHGVPRGGKPAGTHAHGSPRSPGHGHGHGALRLPVVASAVSATNRMTDATIARAYDAQDSPVDPRGSPTDLDEETLVQLRAAVRGATRERLFLPPDRWEACLGKPLDQATAFDVLGQGGLLKANEARSATAVAINRTLALVVRRRHFLPLFVRERRRMIHQADLVQLLATPVSQRTRKHAKQIAYILQSNGLLDIFDPRIRVDLCQGMRLVAKGSGEVLFRQGDVADSFYILIQGMVSLHAKPYEADYSEKYSSDLIGRFGPVTSIVTEGGTLGDMAVARGSVRQQTVVAHEPCRFLSISASVYGLLMQKVEAEERLSQAQYLRKIPGMCDWDPVRLAQVSELFVLEKCKRGQLVQGQGVPCDNMIIIKRGQVQVRFCLEPPTPLDPARRARRVKGPSWPAKHASRGDAETPQHLRSLGREGVEEALALLREADDLVTPALYHRGPRLLDVGVFGPGQFVGDIPVVLGLDSPFQIVAITDCHLHIADHQDIMEAVASDEKALEAMRSAALSKLMFFAQRKLEALRTLTSVSHKILQDKAQTLAPLRSDRRASRASKPPTGNKTGAGALAQEHSVVSVTADGTSLLSVPPLPHVEESSADFLRTELSWISAEPSAVNVARAQPWEGAGADRQGAGVSALPGVHGGRGGSRGEMVWPGGVSRTVQAGTRTRMPSSALRLGKPLSTAGKATAVTLEKSLRVLRPDKSAQSRTSTAGGSAAHWMMFEVMSLVQEACSRLAPST